MTANVPAMTNARKHVEEMVEYYRSANRSHFREQVCLRARAQRFSLVAVVGADRSCVLLLVHFATS